jgi:hypothetical protein
MLVENMELYVYTENGPLPYHFIEEKVFPKEKYVLDENCSDLFRKRRSLVKQIDLDAFSRVKLETLESYTGDSNIININDPLLDWHFSYTNFFEEDSKCKRYKIHYRHWEILDTGIPTKKQHIYYAEFAIRLLVIDGTHFNFCGSKLATSAHKKALYQKCCLFMRTDYYKIVDKGGNIKLLFQLIKEDTNGRIVQKW